jgi:phosphoenolpyruvate phosphomutase
VAVPTSYNAETDEQLAAHGFNIVIYANHLMRAAYPAMQRAALQILRDGRTLELEGELMPIKDVLELIPGARG